MVVMRCFRCELRKGCTVIGAVWLVFSVVFAVGGVLTMMMFQQIAEEEYRNFPGTITPDMEQQAYITLTLFRTCFFGISAIAIADAIVSIMLIIGAQKDRRALVLAWVMEQLALMPVWVLLALAFVTLSFMSSHVLVASIAVFVVAVRIGVTLYSVLVVYGLQEYLRRHETSTCPLSP